MPSLAGADIQDIKGVSTAVDGSIHHFSAHPFQRRLGVRVDGVRKLVHPDQVVRMQVFRIPDLQG